MYCFITVIHADFLLSFPLFTCMGDNMNYLFSFQTSVFNKTENEMYIKFFGALILGHISEIMADTCNISTSRKNE